MEGVVCDIVHQWILSSSDDPLLSHLRKRFILRREKNVGTQPKPTSLTTKPSRPTSKHLTSKKTIQKIHPVSLITILSRIGGGIIGTEQTRGISSGHSEGIWAAILGLLVSGDVTEKEIIEVILDSILCEISEISFFLDICNLLLRILSLAPTSPAAILSFPASSFSTPPTHTPSSSKLVNISAQIGVDLGKKTFFAFLSCYFGMERDENGVWNERFSSEKKAHPLPAPTSSQPTFVQPTLPPQRQTQSRAFSGPGKIEKRGREVEERGKERGRGGSSVAAPSRKRKYEEFALAKSFALVERGKGEGGWRGNVQQIVEAKKKCIALLDLLLVSPLVSLPLCSAFEEMVHLESLSPTGPPHTILYLQFKETVARRIKGLSSLCLSEGLSRRLKIINYDTRDRLDPWFSAPDYLRAFGSFDAGPMSYDEKVSILANLLRQNAPFSSFSPLLSPPQSSKMDGTGRDEMKGALVDAFILILSEVLSLYMSPIESSQFASSEAWKRTNQLSNHLLHFWKHGCYSFSAFWSKCNSLFRKNTKFGPHTERKLSDETTEFAGDLYDKLGEYFDDELEYYPVVGATESVPPLPLKEASNPILTSVICWIILQFSNHLEKLIFAPDNAAFLPQLFSYFELCQIPLLHSAPIFLTQLLFKLVSAGYPAKLKNVRTFFYTRRSQFKSTLQNPYFKQTPKYLKTHDFPYKTPNTEAMATIMYVQSQWPPAPEKVLNLFRQSMETKAGVHEPTSPIHQQYLEIMLPAVCKSFLGFFQKRFLESEAIVPPGYVETYARLLILWANKEKINFSPLLNARAETRNLVLQLFGYRITHVMNNGGAKSFEGILYEIGKSLSQVQSTQIYRHTEAFLLNVFTRMKHPNLIFNTGGDDKVETPRIAKMNMGEVMNKVFLLGLGRVSKVYGAASKVESQSTTEMKESLSSFSSPGINHNEAAQSSQRVRGMNSHQLDQYYKESGNGRFFCCDLWLLYCQMNQPERVKEMVHIGLSRISPFQRSNSCSQFIAWLLTTEMNNFEFTCEFLSLLIYQYKIVTFSCVVISLAFHLVNNERAVAFLMFLIDKDKRLNERLDYFLKQNISPHYESEQFLHHKLMEYEKSFPANDIAHEKTLPTYYANEIIAMLPALDVIFVQLIEAGRVNECIQMAQKFRSIYAYHPSPSSFVFELLHFCSRPSSLLNPLLCSQLLMLIPEQELALYLSSETLKCVKNSSTPRDGFDDAFFDMILERTAKEMRGPSLPLPPFPSPSSNNQPPPPPPFPSNSSFSSSFISSSSSPPTSSFPVSSSECGIGKQYATQVERTLSFSLIELIFLGDPHKVTTGILSAIMKDGPSSIPRLQSAGLLLSRLPEHYHFPLYNTFLSTVLLECLSPFSPPSPHPPPFLSSHLPFSSTSLEYLLTHPLEAHVDGFSSPLQRVITLMHMFFHYAPASSLNYFFTLLEKNGEKPSSLSLFFFACKLIGPFVKKCCTCTADGLKIIQSLLPFFEKICPVFLDSLLLRLEERLNGLWEYREGDVWERMLQAIVDFLLYLHSSFVFGQINLPQDKETKGKINMQISNLHPYLRLKLQPLTKEDN